MQVHGTCPSSEEVHPAATQRAGTGSRKKESDLSLVNQALYFMKEYRQALNLVNDRDSFIIRNLFTEPSGFWLRERNTALSSRSQTREDSNSC